MELFYTIDCCYSSQGFNLTRAMIVVSIIQLLFRVKQATNTDFLMCEITPSMLVMIGLYSSFS